MKIQQDTRDKNPCPYESFILVGVGRQKVHDTLTEYFYIVVSVNYKNNAGRETLRREMHVTFRQDSQAYTSKRYESE